jgi:peroxiredoxin 2/4
MKKKIFLIAMLFLSLSTIQAQKNNDSKIPLIGSEAPAFSAQTTNGDLNFPSDYGSNWKILFSHPRDFTPVCSSELLELSQLQNDFKELGVNLAVISTDNLEKHKQWKSALEEIAFKNNQPTKIKFAIIDDHSCAVSKSYGMLQTPVSTTEDVRGVFIIDPQNKVRAIYFYPMMIGRNMEEIKRTVIALQTSDKEKLATPANWKPGEDMLVTHYPYTKKELADNPELENMYYSVGSFMWYKKAK